MAARQQIDELRIWTPLPQGTTEDKSGVDKKLRDFATHTHRISKSRVVLFGLKFVLLNAQCSMLIRELSNNQCTMCILGSTMALQLKWPCIQYNKKKGWIQGHIQGRRGGYRAIFRGNHGSRVWNSRFPQESCFPSNRTSRDKYMLNNLSRRNF